MLAVYVLLFEMTMTAMGMLVFWVCSQCNWLKGLCKVRLQGRSSFGEMPVLTEGVCWVWQGRGHFGEALVSVVRVCWDWQGAVVLWMGFGAS